MASVELARSFLATHARVLDRLRFERLLGAGDPEALRAALNAYRNLDGGYGRGLEPDLRALESQPVGALHAFEVFAEIGPDAAEEAVGLCDWLFSATLGDGGLPFAVPVRDPSGCAPFWAGADPSTSSLHISAAIASYAYAAAREIPQIEAHPWLERCSDYCVGRIADRDQPQHALELRYCLSFLDAIADRHDAARAQLERLGAFIPPSGQVHVAGGLEDEMLRPLDFSPEPEGLVRGFFDPEVIEADLDRLQGAQLADGGWPLGWEAYSPAAELEWRGYLTVDAIRSLKLNGRI